MSNQPRSIEIRQHKLEDSLGLLARLRKLHEVLEVKATYLEYAPLRCSTLNDLSEAQTLVVRIQSILCEVIGELK